MRQQQLAQLRSFVSTIKSMLKPRRRLTARRLARVDALEGRQLLTAVTAITPFNGQQQVAVGANITVTFDVAMNASTLNSSTVQLRDAANNAVAAIYSYNSTSRTVTIDPTANLNAANTFYYVKVAGGSNGVKDTNGVALTSDFNFAFSTGTPVFNDSTAFSGLSAPTAVKFAPDGRVFVAEKSGLIKVFSNLSDTTADVFADLRTNVHNFWDRGLLGIALDPQFTEGRPYVYVLYTYDSAIGGNAPTYGTAGGTSDPGTGISNGTGPIVSGRLSRLTANGNFMTGSELVLVNDWAIQFPSHTIGDLHFGPDGYLYASAGDGASFTFADYGQVTGINDPTNEGGALRSQDVRTTADPTGLHGSVIRIDPNTGLAAPGNPNTTGDVNAQRIIAYGMRNPFRFTFRPGSNELWIGDVGWNSWEEINRIISPTDSTVENFGWPAYEGPNRQSAYDNLNLPLLESLYTDANGHTLPYFGYSHSQKVVANSTEPTGGSSVAALAFYNGGQYPSAYDGALFWADYSRKQIYVMYRGVNGLPDPSTRQIFKSQANGSVFLQAGPNGDLFYVDMDLGRIGRFTFNSNNAAPTARITANTTAGNSPLTVNFSGATSTDPDAGDVLTYAWDLDGDGEFDDSTAIAPTYVYTTTGSRTVRLRVTDRVGLTHVATQTITVNGSTNTAPTPTITSPIASLNWKVGDTITFAGGATDAQDGTLAASRLSWQLAIIHASATDPSSQHSHIIQTYNGVANGSFQAPDHEYPSWLELSLTATDSGGLSSTTVVRIDPMTTNVTLTSNLIGVLLSLNSETIAAPFSRTVITNGNSAVGAPASVTLSGTTYNFIGWSDGGAISHNFTAPTGDISLAATYAVAGSVKATGTIIGTPGSWNNTGNTRDKAFDGNLNTFFDAAEWGGAWVGLDLGSARQVTQVNYAPRGYHTSRMIGGKFQGSNSADFSSGVVDLHTITSAPDDARLTTAVITNPGTFRYVRYLSPDGSYGNIAEAEFFVAAVTPPPPVVPSAPSGLVASATSPIQINLTWTDTAADETGFRIERKTGGGSFATVATINTPNTTSYADANLIAGTLYTYRVVAFNAVGSSGFSNEASATTQSAGVLTNNVVREFWSGISGKTVTSIPVNNTPTSTSLLSSLEIPVNANGSNWGSRIRGYIQAPASGSYTFWIASDDYSELWLSTNDNPANKVKRASVVGYTTSRQWSKYASQKSVAVTLTAGQLYYFEILHKQGSGGSNMAVGWAKPGQATTAPSEVIPASVLTQFGTAPVTVNAPTGLTATASSSAVALNWTDNSSNESGFKIERSVSGGAFSEIAAVGANVRTYNDTGLAASTNYAYRVRAYVGSTNSAYSNTASAVTPAGQTIAYLSDLPFATTPINGWGPVERDMSVGELPAGDGRTITLNGVTYAKGLGVHSDSEITYNLGGQYTSFLSDIGVDDETGDNGSVTFEVWIDGVKAYDSGVMTGDTATKSINLSVLGASTLKLIVTDAGDSIWSDHASWGGARLVK